MEEKIKSWSELNRIVSVLNGEEKEKESDEFKSGDLAKAQAGTKTAIVRVRKAMQTVKDLTQAIRKETQDCK